MKYPKGTTHISVKDSNIKGKPYKVDRVDGFFDVEEIVHFWCEYQNKWIESINTKRDLKLVLLESK